MVGDQRAEGVDSRLYKRRVVTMFKHDDIHIRLVEEMDAPFLKDLRGDPEVWKNLGNVKMVTEESQRLWIASLQNSSKAYYIICLEDDTPVGLVRCDEIDSLNRSIRIGADIHKSFRGKGYGTKVYELLLKYTFDYLNMNRVWLCVAEFNNKARKLYDKFNFVEEGRYREFLYREGKYHDYIILSILRKEYVSGRPD